MRRYKVNIQFGPWLRDEEFESDDEFHAQLAADGQLLTDITDAPR